MMCLYIMLCGEYLLPTRHGELVSDIEQALKLSWHHAGACLCVSTIYRRAAPWTYALHGLWEDDQLMYCAKGGPQACTTCAVSIGHLDLVPGRRPCT